MFQFQCPQGHLLEGEESQAGQAIPCPVCGMLFLIPQPVVAPVVAPQAAAAAPTPPAASEEPEILHIPCPNGHELEVPPDMLDTEVLCPACNVQFHLRAKDSIEHKRRREEQQAARDAKTNKFWYQFSIGTAIVVVLMLFTLMLLSALNSSPPESKKKRKAKSKTSTVEKTEPTEKTDSGEKPTEPPGDEPSDSMEP